MAARALTACDLGDTCDPSDYRLSIPCVQREICVNSRDRLVAVMLSQSSKDPAGDYRRVDDLRSRITAAVRQLNVAAFQPSVR